MSRRSGYGDFRFGRKGRGQRLPRARRRTIRLHGGSDDAVAKVQELCQARLNGGAEIVTVVVSPSPHPWAPFAGIFKDDPDFQEVVEIIAENRRKMDTDETIP